MASVWARQVRDDWRHGLGAGLAGSLERRSGTR